MAITLLRDRGGGNYRLSSVNLDSTLSVLGGMKWYWCDTRQQDSRKGRYLKWETLQ